MKTNIKKSLMVLTVLFAVIFAIPGCQEADGAQQTKELKNEASASNIEVVRVKAGDYTDYLTVLGSLKPVRKAEISYQEGGKLQKKVNDKGSYVSMGDTIVIIENDILKANLDAAEAQYLLAKVTFDKQEEIRKENINSEYQFLQSKYNMQQAKANYDLMKARYAKTFITAPFAGMVDNIYYEEGEMTLPGTPVVNLISSNRMKVEAGVPERYAGKITKGTKAIVSFATLNIEPINGVVSFVGSSIFADNRTFPIEIELNNQERILKPGLVSEVKIAAASYNNIITIPDEVVSKTDKGYMVYLAENGKAVSRQIEILSRSGDSIAVKSGLKNSDELIVVGYQNLLDGDNVKIVN